MKKLIPFTLVACVFFITSCTHRLTDFTIISTKNVDLSRASQFTRTGNRTEGKDRTHIILFIPIGRPDMKEAIDRAIESTKGAIALVDGVVYQKSWWIPYIYGQQSIIVEGSPLIDPLLAMNEKQENDTYTVLTLDKNSKVKSQKSITPEEYNKFKNKIKKDGVKSTFKNSTEITIK